MSNALIGLLSTLLATNQPAALSNLISQHTGISVTLPNPTDPLEREFQVLMNEDDNAQTEVDEWILAARKQEAEGDNMATLTLRARIDQRFKPVKQGYEEFIQKYPQHSRARIAYGSFLNDIGEEQAASEHFKKAVEIDPKEPSGWNNLANYYGHNGPVSQAFDCYAKALALRPLEPVYYQNLATTMYLFRRDATNYFNLTLEEVFDKSLALYAKALELDPTNFILATDLAMSYYGIPIPKTGREATDEKAARQHYDRALAAWRVALKIARDRKEREGVYIHLARNQINAGDFDDARTSLAMVTDPIFDKVVARLQTKLENREGPGSRDENSPPADNPLE